jgi:hypothetical protein
MDVDWWSGGHISHKFLFVLEEAKQLSTKDGIEGLPASECGFFTTALQLVFSIDVAEWKQFMTMITLSRYNRFRYTYTNI